MRAVRYLAALVVALLVHVLAVRLVPEFPRVLDLFLVLLVLNALDGRSLSGLLGGMVAGLLEDGVHGAPYGLHGIAGAIVGYAVARATQQIETQQPATVALVFALATALQQAIVVGLLLLLASEGSAPQLSWLAAKVVACGLFGVLLVAGRTALLERWATRRLSRVARVRM